MTDVVANGAATLAIDHLDVGFSVRGRPRAVIRDLSLRVGRGEAYGLVGESGCGKSTVAFAIMRYLAGNGRITNGRILLAGRDVLSAREPELRRLRAGTVSMVYQDPGKALNPSIRVGRQLAEAFEVAGSRSSEATLGALQMLERVRIVDPRSVMDRYPHQLSGGMQQRVGIAMALAARPALLILDEPTTGLDVTVEAEVLDLISEFRRELGTSILFISHNLAVISQVCERVGVLYAGMLVEEGLTADVFREPRHPYTLALLRCVPRTGQRKADGRLDTIPGGLPGPGAALAACPFEPRCPLAETPCRTVTPLLEPAGNHLARCHFRDAVPALAALPPKAPAASPSVEPGGAPVLSARQIGKTFKPGAKRVRALADVSLDLWPGETVGVVGESGSGKSTLARVLVGLTVPDDGSSIELDGAALPLRLDKRAKRQVKAVQIVFQNPDSALNRAHTVRRIVGRALQTLAGLRGRGRAARLLELASAVRLPERDIDAKPRRLSGGLKQRVAIARAFAGEPRIVICDEPTSALDVSVQAAILNLLVDLQERSRTSYVFISHDLSVVRYLADRILVLYMGQVMEIGRTEDVVTGPKHPYTDTLLAAAPSLGDRGRSHSRLAGEMPSAVDPPSGCVFHTRCPRRFGPICDELEPPLIEIAPEHLVRCHLPPDELPRGSRLPSQAAAPAGADPAWRS